MSREDVVLLRNQDFMIKLLLHMTVSLSVIFRGRRKLLKTRSDLKTDAETSNPFQYGLCVYTVLFLANMRCNFAVNSEEKRENLSLTYIKPRATCLELSLRES